MPSRARRRRHPHTTYWATWDNGMSLRSSEAIRYAARLSLQRCSSSRARRARRQPRVSSLLCASGVISILRRQQRRSALPCPRSTRSSDRGVTRRFVQNRTLSRLAAFDSPLFALAHGIRRQIHRDSPFKILFQKRCQRQVSWACPLAYDFEQIVRLPQFCGRQTKGRARSGQGVLIHCPITDRICSPRHQSCHGEERGRDGRMRQ
jgi:hypothetical protein